MLIVKVFGGLGNQMFQYAFYKSLKQCNKDVYLDISDFEVHHHHYGFELEKVFSAQMDLANKMQVQKVAVNNNTVLYRFCRKLLKLEVKKRCECIAHEHCIVIEPSEITQDMYFNGYWQNTVYLKEMRDALRKDFSFKKPLSKKNELLAAQIDATESAFIHVRRGDYLNSANLCDVCTLQYYQNAVQLLQDKVHAELSFFVFSDDINWVKKELPLSGQVTYVDWNIGEESYRDMQLMSLCKHSIICNSTFSWWGAYLKKDTTGFTIMPKKWTLEENSSRLQFDGVIAI